MEVLVCQYLQELILKVYMPIFMLKKKRIAKGSGEKIRTPGTKGAPTAKAFKQSAKTAKKH